ncbi:MAG: hypothetical protein DRJ42_22615 [Deltaproteobacteria bacterium]|nr:MAG: hypothetical protein DRJ42_22615 [Deltaproteobacteria bacterium]
MLWEGQPREVGRPHIGGGSTRSYQMVDGDGDGHLDIVQTSVGYAGDLPGTTTRQRVFALRGDSFEPLRVRPPAAAADPSPARAAAALGVAPERVGVGSSVPLAVTYFRRWRLMDPENMLGLSASSGDPVASMLFAGPAVAIARVVPEGDGPVVEHFIRFEGSGDDATASDLGLTGAAPVAAQQSAPCRVGFSSRSRLRSTEWTGDGVERALVYTWFRTPTELVGRLYRVRDTSVEAVGEPMLLERCGEEARDVLVHPVVGGGTPELETVALRDDELGAWGD